MHRTRVIEWLDAYRLQHPLELDTIDRFQAFVETETRCFERDCWRGHVTGSAWVVNAPGTHVLLTHHRKLDRWLQLGGHSDGDPDTLRVACREALEESGLPVTPLFRSPFDVDIHSIPARGADPAHLHYDLRFALVASNGAFRTSDESHALRWVGVDDIESVTDEASMLRMADKWRTHVRSHSP